MNIGDELSGPELSGLPVRSVAVCDETDEGCGHNVIVRTVRGFDWYSDYRGKGSLNNHDLDALYAPGPFTVVYLPAPAAPKVGDTVTTEAQARALPIGSVVVDTADAAPKRAAAVKVGDDKWLFEGVYPSGPQHCGDEDVCGDGEDVVVHIPDADTGAGSTAA